MILLPNPLPKPFTTVRFFYFWYISCNMITDYESLVDKIDVISQDAYRMGRIEGVRYDPHDYNILGLIVKYRI